MPRRTFLAVRLKKLILLIAALGLALALGEGGLRLVFPRGIAAAQSLNEIWPWIVYDAVLGWTNQANYTSRDFSIGDLNFRDSRLEGRKRPDVLRVICLGDSRTFGIWLDRGRFRYDNDYPRFLAELTAQAPDSLSVEVINAGVIGYTASHGLRQLVTRLHKLDPDILILGFGINEPARSWNPALRAHEPRNAGLRKTLYALSGARLLELVLWTRSQVPRFHPAANEVPWATPEEYAHSLKRLAQEGHERGLRVLFLKQGLRPIEMGGSLNAFPVAEENPDHFSVWGVSDLASLHRLHDLYQGILVQVAEEENVPVADAEASLANGTHPPYFGPYDLVHPNVDGARLVARTVYDQLAERGWLRPGEHASGPADRLRRSDLEAK